VRRCCLREARRFAPRLADASVPVAGKLIISIVAGLPLHSLERTTAPPRALSRDADTPALVQGAAATRGPSRTEDDACSRKKSSVGSASLCA